MKDMFSVFSIQLTCGKRVAKHYYAKTSFSYATIFQTYSDNFHMSQILPSGSASFEWNWRKWKYQPKLQKSKFKSVAFNSSSLPRFLDCFHKSGTLVEETSYEKMNHSFIYLLLFHEHWSSEDELITVDKALQAHFSE